MSTDGTGNVADSRMIQVRDQAEFIPEYIANLWTQFRTSAEYYQWRIEVEEVKTYLYATDTNMTSNSSNPHSHTTHLPKLTQIADALQAHYMDALFPHGQWQQFVPGTDSDLDEKTKRLLEEYIRNRHRLSGHRMHFNQIVKDWIEEGCCVTETLYKTEIAEQTDDNLTRTAYSGPITRRIEPKRVAFNPEATSFSESWKIVQSIKTRGDIALDIMDSTKPEEYREVLTKAIEFRNYVRDFGDTLGEDWLNSSYHGFGTNGAYYGISDTVEILTFYGSIWDHYTRTMMHNRKLVVVDRKWLIIDEPIDTWDGKPHIYRSTWRQRPNSLMPMGPLQNLTGMQYKINHLENARADAFDMMIHPDRLFRMVEDRKRQPDGTTDYYTHDAQGDVRNISPDTTVLNADFQIDRMERKMEEYAGVPPEAMGMKMPGEQTKFEVSERLTAAGRLFNAKIKQFEDEVISPTLNAELELAKTHLDQNLRLLVSLDEGDIFEELTPDLIRNKGTFVPVGATHYMQQQRLTQELTGLMQALSMDPELKQHFPAANIGRAYERLLGGLGTRDGLFQEFGRLVEQTEAQQRLQGAQAIVDSSADAIQQAAGGPPEEVPLN